MQDISVESVKSAVESWKIHNKNQSWVKKINSISKNLNELKEILTKFDEVENEFLQSFYINSSDGNLRSTKILELGEKYERADYFFIDKILETNILNSIREQYLEQDRSISDTSFLSILSGEATDEKIDFGEKYVNLFQSFINSTQSNSFTNYRTLLCIMTKMLFYDGEHIQNLFNEMAYDKHFFKNLNRELNYYIVQCIDLSQKYELCSRCAEITDIAKLTIQFLQLLGEGFNTQFHENILKGVVKEQEKSKTRNDIYKYNLNKPNINLETSVGSFSYTFSK